RRLELRALVFVAAAPPRASARLVASLRRPVEPLIHPPQAVEAARVGGVRVVDDAVLERERAHARRFAEERVEIDAHALRVPRAGTALCNGGLPKECSRKNSVEINAWEREATSIGYTGSTLYSSV